MPQGDTHLVGGKTTKVCDAWPVRRQTYGYLLDRRASPPVDRTKLYLVTESPGYWQLAQSCCLTVHCPGVEPVTSRLRVRHANNYSTKPSTFEYLEIIYIARDESLTHISTVDSMALSLSLFTQ